MVLVHFKPCDNHHSKLEHETKFSSIKDTDFNKIDKNVNNKGAKNLNMNEWFRYSFFVGEYTVIFYLNMWPDLFACNSSFCLTFFVFHFLVNSSFNNSRKSIQIKMN